MSGPKKELGQHWLHDAATLEAIVLAANVQAGDRVLEIGPGLGTLTDVLDSRGATVTALEFDRDLLGDLQQKYKNRDNVAITYGDIRTFDLSKLPRPYKIVANIPYYLTSNLIRTISESTNPPQVAVLLVQKEVAERICAGPGQMSVLSVVAQFYFGCKLDVVVPAHLFSPPPKVDSQVVVLERRGEKLFDVDDGMFFRIVKAGFSERRKTLRNTMSSGLRLGKGEAEQLLQKADIDPQRRAQELTLGEWHAIYTAYVTLH